MVILGHWSAMNKDELLLINGGAAISGTIINAVVRMFNLALEIGRTIGSTIRRKEENAMCTLE